MAFFIDFIAINCYILLVRYISTKMYLRKNKLLGGKIMSKTELVEFVAAEANVSKAEAGRVLDAVLAGIQKGLKKDGKVALVGFGTFSSKKRAAREGINPLTKQPMKIPAKNVISFKAGSKLKDSVN